jgi:hypothetical protein
MDSKYRSFRSLFTSSPKLQGYATAYKFTTVEYILRWRTHTGVIEEQAVVGLYDAALAAVQHTENTGLKVYAFAPDESGAFVEHWFTRLRDNGKARVCASGYTSTLDKVGWIPATPENPTVARRGPSEPLTKIEKSRAVKDLFTPRLASPPTITPPSALDKPRLSVGLPDWLKRK